MKYTRCDLHTVAADTQRAQQQQEVQQAALRELGVTLTQRCAICWLVGKSWVDRKDHVCPHARGLCLRCGGDSHGARRCEVPRVEVEMGRCFFCGILCNTHPGLEGSADCPFASATDALILGKAKRMMPPGLPQDINAFRAHLFQPDGQSTNGVSLF